MKMNFNFIKFLSAALVALTLAACQGTRPVQTSTNLPKVIAAESFLAEITRNIAGDRLGVDSLIPLDVDPHAFEPTPKDVARLSDSRVLVINGGSLESWLAPILQNTKVEQIVITASKGLVERQPNPGEVIEPGEGDPHFWLDPTKVITYAENIRDGLIQADPDGKDTYTRNAAAYIKQLNELDAWISDQVKTIPPEKRLIVTNHESFGYYADRYGFQITGTVIPSISTNASPSAQQLAALIDHIRSTGTKAIFLETGANPQLAQQISRETGVKVITGLYTHSVTAAGGAAPSYIDMMKVNTRMIVEALK